MYGAGVTKTALILANPTAKRGEAAIQRVVAKLTAGYEAAGWEVIACCTERELSLIHI